MLSSRLKQGNPQIGILSEKDLPNERHWVLDIIQDLSKQIHKKILNVN